MTAPNPAGTDDHGARAKTLRGLLLARELDEARHRRGYSTRALAATMNMSAAMLNRVMTGRRVPTALEIGGLCAVLDIPAHRRPVLYQRTATVEHTEWVIHPDTARNPVRDVEAFADDITWFEPTLIPRPLRTSAYDLALGNGRNPAEQAADLAALRISRFLLHPLVLNHPAIPEDVLRGQLRHLLDNHLTRIRLLPASVDPRPGFRVLHIGHFAPVVHIEHHDTDLLLENPTATSRHTTFLKRVNDVALTTAETRDLLQGLKHD
jgi:transcriptional regulator with XRE-family HTH domain